MSLFDQIAGFFGTDVGTLAGGAAGIAASNYAVNEGQQALGNIREDLMERSGITGQGSLASQINDKGSFTPFTVSNNLGGTSFNPATGQMNITGGEGISQGLMQNAQQGLNNLGQGFGLSNNFNNQAFAQSQQGMGNYNQIDPNIASQQQYLGTLFNNQFGQFGQAGNTQQALGNNLQNMGMERLAGAGINQDIAGLSGMFGDQAQQMLQQTQQDPNDIYAQIRAIQSPEEERQRIALENRLAGQGRLGVSTSAYGGTPEQLAMEKAQAEARNSAAYQSLQQADQLNNSQFQRASNAAGMSGNLEQLGSQLLSDELNRGSGLFGLGSQQQQLSQGMDTQQIQNLLGLQSGNLQATQGQSALDNNRLAQAQSLFGMGQQSSMLPSQLDSMNLQNIVSQMQASGIPLQQQLSALQPALTASGMQQTGDLAQLNALAQLGTAELGMLKELGLGGATLDQELLRTIGNIFAGGGRIS